MTLMPVSYRTYTPEQFLEVEDAHRFELIDGDLVERNMGSLSSFVGGKFLVRLGSYAEDDAAGLVIPSDGGLRIFAPEHPSWVRFPDVAYYAKGAFPNECPPEGWSEEVPTLVVEVISPNDRAGDIEDKVQLWLNAGVPTVWVAYPEIRTVVVRKPGNTVTFLQGEQLVTDEHLPGFAAPASSFFPALP
jgi:Uma2 family endonuclease